MPDDLLTPVAFPVAAGDGRRGPRRPWRLALASPFLLCLAALLVTGRTLPVFWGDDETIVHWPLTLRFAACLPHFDPSYALSATTPLMQLFGACVVRLAGPHLTLLRALNTLFAVVGVCVLFGSLRRSRRHEPGTAALLTAVLLTSCYFFGYAFRWLTDDPALTFAILALAQLFRFADPDEPRRQRAFLFGCLWLSGAILTRQSYAFLCLPFGLTLLAAGLPPGALAVGLGGMTLAVAPFAALVLAWHGLVPPVYHVRHASSLVKPYAASLPLMLLGFYTPFFTGPELWRQRAAIPRQTLLWPALGAAAGLAAVWQFPLMVTGHPREALTHFPPEASADAPGYFAGWLYNISKHLPGLHGNSLLFWALLPLGGAAAAGFLRAAALPGVDPLQRVAILYLLGLVLSSTLNSVCAQKYYDAPILLFLLWQSRGEAARDPWRRTLLGGLILLFTLYFLISISIARPQVPHSSPPTAVSP